MGELAKIPIIVVLCESIFDIGFPPKNGNN